MSPQRRHLLAVITCVFGTPSYDPVRTTSMGSSLDKVREKAHRLVRDEVPRVAERADEAHARIDAGKLTLTALLEGNVDVARAKAQTLGAGSPAIGKLTQTLIAHAPQLVPHRAELAAVIVRIDAAKSELMSGAKLEAVAAPLERAMTSLLARAGIPPDAMPRDLLGDLVGGEAPAPIEAALPPRIAEVVAPDEPEIPRVEPVAPAPRIRRSVPKGTAPHAAPNRARRPSRTPTTLAAVAPHVPSVVPTTKDARPLGVERAALTSLAVIDPSSLGRFANETLDVDATPPALVTRATETTTMSLRLALPAVVGRVASSPLPRSLRLRVPRLDKELGRSLSNAATTTAAATAASSATAGITANRVGDDSERSTSKSLGADRKRAHELATAANRRARGPQHPPELSLPAVATTEPPAPVTSATAIAAPVRTVATTARPAPASATTIPTSTLTAPTTATRATAPTEARGPSTAMPPARAIDAGRTSAVSATKGDAYRRALASDEQRVDEVEREARTDSMPTTDQLAARQQQLGNARDKAKHDAKHHAQHQDHRKQTGKHRANRAKTKLDARGAELRSRQQAYAERSKQQLIAELQQHATLALALLDMNKDQRIAELNRRLEEQKPQIRAALDQGKAAATERWNADKLVLGQANTAAITKIDADCDNERTITTNNFKVIRQQLQTNPEQAALKALALSKADQERIEGTKKANVHQIQTASATAVKAAQARVAAAMKVSQQRDETGQATPAANAAAKQIGELTTEIGRLIAQCARDVTAETTTYDGLIERRKTSGDNAAREIRTDAKAYLASLGDKEAEALREIERLRAEGKDLAKQRYDHDCERIAGELDREFQRLDAEFVHEQIEAEQARDLAIKDTSELTLADKQKARTDITKNRDAGVRKIQHATLAQLGEMTRLVATSRAAIDQNLAGLGQATVLATREISTLSTDFDRRIDRVKQYLESKTNTAIANQARIANATKAGLQTLRSRRHDSTGDTKWGDVSRDLMAERSDFYQQQEEEKRFDAQRKAELDHLKTREDPDGRRNLKPEAKEWNEQTRAEKAQEITKALEGGFGKDGERLMFDYNALRLAFATMTPEQIQDLLARNPHLKELLGQANPADKLCLDQVINAKDPTDMRAALLNWSTNGALGNDKTAGTIAALVTPLGYLASAGGYDKATMEAMFNSMSEAEKHQLDAVYKDKYGLSVIDEIKDEAYSVANRDSMLASWSSDPAEKLRLKAQSSELSGTYGNIVGGIKNAGYLFGYEMSNEQAMNVFMAPQDLISSALTKVTGDDSWTERQDLVKKQGLDMMIDPDALMTAQRGYLESMKPTPYDSKIEQLRKQQLFKDTQDNLRVDGRSLTELDEAASNNGYQQLFGGNQEMSDAFKALRENDEERFLRQRMLAGLHQRLGSETWVKEGIEDAVKRGKMGELQAELARSGTTYDELVEKRFRGWYDTTDNVDSTYFKVLGEKPADPTSEPDAYARQVAAKLAYYQLGGLTGFSNDTAGIEREVANLPAELKEKVQEQYKTIVASKTTMLPTWLSEVTNPLGNWSTGNVWEDLELTYGGEWNRWSRGLLGKGTDYAKLQYDIDHGKAMTPEDQYKRALARYQLDTTNTQASWSTWLLGSSSSKFATNEARLAMEQLQDEYARLSPELRTANVDTLSPDQRAQLAGVTMQMAIAAGWQDTGNATQVSYVETVGWIVGTTVSTVIIVAGSIFTGGAVAAIVVPIAAAVIGGLSVIGVKMAMLGDKYSGNMLQQDFASMVIDAVSSGVIGAGEFTEVATKLVKGLGVEGAIARTVLRELIENAAQVPGGLAHALLNPEVWKGDSAQVLQNLRGLVATEAVKLAATTIVGAGTRIGLGIPADATELSTFHDTLLAALKAGTGATCEIDPSRPLGDQLLNVVKAVAVATIQPLATGAGKKIRERMTSRSTVTALERTSTKPSAERLEVSPDGTIVIPKEDSARYLKELARAASQRGEKVSFDLANSVDANGRRIVVVKLSDGTSTRIAIDDAVVTRPTTTTAPRRLGTGEDGPLQELFTREVDRSRDGVSPVLTWKAITEKATRLQAEHPVLATMSQQEVIALVGITTADSVDVNRGLGGGGGEKFQREATRYAQQVDSALAKLPSEPGVYRRMVAYDAETLAQLEPGALIKDPTIVDATNGKVITSRGNVEVVIEGTHAKRLDFLAPRNNESPFLFRSNTTFEVVSVSADRRRVVMREVERPTGWIETLGAPGKTKMPSLAEAAKISWDGAGLNRTELDRIYKNLGPRRGLVPYQDKALARLELIIAGKLQATEVDRRFFHHERIEAELRRTVLAGENENLKAHLRTIRRMRGVGDNPYDLYHPETGARDHELKTKPYESGAGAEYEDQAYEGWVDPVKPEL